jgi:hypothetical protein
VNIDVRTYIQRENISGGMLHIMMRTEYSCRIFSMMGIIYTYGLFYALFFSKASYQFTPIFNLRPLIFGLKPHMVGCVTLF